MSASPFVPSAANLRKVAVLTVAACLLLGLGLLFRDRERPAPEPVARPVERLQVPPPAAAVQPTEVVDHPVIAAAAELLAEGGTAATDLEIVTLILADYRKACGGNPVGENEEVTALLLGGNPKGLRFLPPGHRAIDGAGRLCDRWGTPLFFHALSSRQMAVHSAGPDRQHGTADDLAGPDGAE
jgi:hypothetical protein